MFHSGKHKAARGLLQALLIRWLLDYRTGIPSGCAGEASVHLFARLAHRLVTGRWRTGRDTPSLIQTGLNSCPI
jgi:hypothetical protein